MHVYVCYLTVCVGRSAVWSKLGQMKDKDVQFFVLTDINLWKERVFQWSFSWKAIYYTNVGTSCLV
jgi:hypothetical protein